MSVDSVYMLIAYTAKLNKWILLGRVGIVDPFDNIFLVAATIIDHFPSKLVRWWLILLGNREKQRFCNIVSYIKIMVYLVKSIISAKNKVRWITWFIHDQPME